MDYSGLTNATKVGKKPVFVETEDGPPGSAPVTIKEGDPEVLAEDYEGKNTAPVVNPAMFPSNLPAEFSQDGGQAQDTSPQIQGIMNRGNVLTTGGGVQ